MDLKLAQIIRIFHSKIFFCGVFLLAYVLLTGYVIADTGQAYYRFKTFANKELDTLGGQWDTVQDTKGFLWFGGAGGVARYDGYDLTFYKNDPDDPRSLSDNYVVDLLIDSKG